MFGQRQNNWQFHTLTAQGAFQRKPKRPTGPLAAGPSSAWLGGSAQIGKVKMNRQAGDDKNQIIFQ